MKTWYKTKDGIIDRVTETADDNKPYGNGWQEGPTGLYKYQGQKIEWFDALMNRIPDKELLNQGKRKDNRGRYYNVSNIGESMDVTELDIESPGKDWTKEAPLENEPYQKWDAKKKQWIVDSEKKEIAEIEGEIGKLRGEISSRDWKVTKASRLGKEIDEIYPGETSWYTETVAEINRLEKMLEEKISA